MKKFAVLENELVLNTIVADSKEIAEQITGKVCIEYTTESAETGGTYVDGVFTQAPRPEINLETELLVEE